MKNWVFLLALLGFAQQAFGQVCLHADVSGQFVVRTHFRRINEDLSIVVVAILDKVSGQTKDSVSYRSAYRFDKVFEDCKSVLSYRPVSRDSTNSHDEKVGDLIVADFNFDGLDDFALIKDSQGGSDPLYDFYLQGEMGRFQKDRFLSERMEIFPSQIDTANQQLVTYNFAGYCLLGKHVYSYNAKTKSWRQKSRELIHVCNQKATNE